MLGADVNIERVEEFPEITNFFIHFFRIINYL
jgi:hypothetical protein